MSRYRFELVLAGVLIVVCAAVWWWQAPGKRLNEAELDRYMKTVETQLPIPAGERSDFLLRLRMFGQNDDGRPVYMLNLMRYNRELDASAGIPASFKGTPAEANAYYESQTIPLLFGSGTAPTFMGNVHERNVTPSAEKEDGWDRILVIRYPSRRAFFDLLTSPAYAKIAPYKLGALHVALVPMRRELVVPDVRLAALVIALIALLGIGWLREARRGRG